VEIRAGTRPKDNLRASPTPDSHCAETWRNRPMHWISKDRFIKWNGVLYCDWMPAEHWTSPQNGNGFKVWYKLDEKSTNSGRFGHFSG